MASLALIAGNAARSSILGDTKVLHAVDDDEGQHHRLDLHNNAVRMTPEACMHRRTGCMHAPDFAFQARLCAVLPGDL